MSITEAHREEGNRKSGVSVIIFGDLSWIQMAGNEFRRALNWSALDDQEHDDDDDFTISLIPAQALW